MAGDKKNEDRRLKTQETKADSNQELCVVSRNVNKSSVQYDFLRDVDQIQANVAMLHETQNWKKYGAAG